MNISSASSKGDLKVLVIDDEKDMVDLITSELATKANRVVAAKDGLEGIFKFNNESFSLIITDLKMPKMDGFQFAQQVRKTDEEIPILFISGDWKGLQKQIGQLKNIAFITKPFNMDEMLEKIEILMASRRKNDGKVDAIEEINLSSNDILFEEGDISDEIFFIKSGTLDVFRKIDGKDILITSLKSGEIVGEISCLLKKKRTATVKAREPSQLMKISQSKLGDSMSDIPKWLRVLLQTVVSRLNDTTEALAKERREQEDHSILKKEA